MWLGCTLEVVFGLCSWEVLKGVQRNLFVKCICFCQVLLNERNKSEKLVCYPKESWLV